MAASGGHWKNGKFVAARASSDRRVARLSDRERTSVFSMSRSLGPTRSRFTQDVPRETAEILRRSGLFNVTIRPPLFESAESFVRVEVRHTGITRALQGG